MIGIFDSGVGGLSVLRVIRTLAPHLDVTYFGDIQNAPYGNKSRSELARLTARSIRTLLSRDIPSVVSACNSLSGSIALSTIEIVGARDVSFIEMVGPTVASFVGKQDRILVAATRATIDSEIYQSNFHIIGKSIVSLPIPDLAMAIEEGLSKERVRAIIQATFDTVDLQEIDTVILGCTHYALVGDVFREIIPSRITIQDPAEPVGRRVVERFGSEGSGKTICLLSKESLVFRKYVQQLGFENASIEII
jgi:glutamate racemase